MITKLKKPIDLDFEVLDKKFNLAGLPDPVYYFLRDIWIKHPKGFFDYEKFFSL